MIAIRGVEPADAKAMSDVLIASIRHLCTEDHNNIAHALARWTANKTPDGVRAMMGDPELVLFVAERDGDTAAVGGITGGGEIVLNYVDPQHRFTGVSRALLIAMEEALRRNGIREAHLVSTRTAHRFYRDAGWQDAGAPVADPVIGYPMRKTL